MDRLPWSKFHWLVIIALGITWILDGLEITLAGTIGPTLTSKQTLGMSESQVGLTATAYLAGA
ncbi:MAG: MFS transporter, partial [Actinomycetota bacterium]